MLGTLVQLVAGALAVLLTLESRRHARRTRQQPPVTTAETATEFQTWRIVRWDDENDSPHMTPCDRDPVAAQRSARNSRQRTNTPVTTR